MKCEHCGTDLLPHSHGYHDKMLCRDALRQQRDEARAEVERLRICLVWYADPDGGTDGGEWAKAILAAPPASVFEGAKTSEANVAVTAPSGAGIINLASPEIATSVTTEPASASEGAGAFDAGGVWKRLDECRSDDGDGSKGTIVAFGYEKLSETVHDLIAQAEARGRAKERVGQ